MESDMLFDIFKQAIVSEYEAYRFYSDAASHTTHQEAKSLFEKLAGMEMRHKTELEDLYKTLRP